MDPSIIMRDPKTANSRIYIGNIPENSRSEIEEHFSKFGQIIGVILNRGFGFIQFDSEECATNAIKSEDGSQFMGRKLIVRNAQQNNNGGNENKRGGGGGGPMGGGGGGGGNPHWRVRGNQQGNQGNQGGGGGKQNIWNDRDRSPIDDKGNIGGGEFYA